MEEETPLSHPDIIPFLERARDNGIICNMTVNELHLKQFKKLITTLIKENLIKGLGITYSGRHKEELKYFAGLTDNLVFHVIMGVHDLSCLDEIQEYSNKVLILGYKEFRKGKSFHSKEVEDKKYLWYIRLPLYFKKMILSFDNLAISQLDLKRWFTEESWNEFYMGDDATFTFYIDAVENKYAGSSTHKERFDVTKNVKKCSHMLEKKKRKLIVERGKDKSIIPRGHYCYSDVTCPYWHYKEEGKYGNAKAYCSYLDFDGGLIWDQVKECGINEN